jgi:hypothetical protein
MSTYNWSHIDEEAMKKADPEKYRRWRIVEMLNHGLGGEKLNKKEVMELWNEIKGDINIETRRFVEYLLWGTIYSLPINIKSWNSPKLIPR